MSAGFIAVVRAGSTVDLTALHQAGAISVLSWAELATSAEPDDMPTVLLDLPETPAEVDLVLETSDTDSHRLIADLTAVLGTLSSVDPFGGDTGGSVRSDQDVVIATVRPVVDTLKLVDGDGMLTGTAERDEHRFVDTPIATRLRVLRAVARELPATIPPAPAAAAPAGNSLFGGGPSPVAVLSVLVSRGATVLGSTP